MFFLCIFVEYLKLLWYDERKNWGDLKVNIPHFIDRDDYLQNPIMRKFLKSNNISLAQNRADYIHALEEYSNEDTEKAQKVEDFLLKVIKEGTKDLCYRQIQNIKEWNKNPDLVKNKIDEKYPDCPKSNILHYRNTQERELIDYQIKTNENGLVSKIEFAFSRLFLCGEAGETGDLVPFPVFVDVYLDEGFVVSRGKAKTTMYYKCEDDILVTQNGVNSMDYAVTAIDAVIELLDAETEREPAIVKRYVYEKLYNIYNLYSFTPEKVEEMVNKEQERVESFVNGFFSELGLNPRNMDKARLDANILIEKFVSINGNNEDIFKNDRAAYLTKVRADDEVELTRVDTASNRTVPLQCTEAFFDGKKSVIKSKQCKKLDLVFKRQDEAYQKGNPLEVQFGVRKNYGYIKFRQYAEEGDIQNVLQTIFRS